MIENPLDGRSFQDRGDDLEFTTAVWAVLKIEVKQLPENRDITTSVTTKRCAAGTVFG
jgi:hypothetical protein